MKTIRVLAVILLGSAVISEAAGEDFIIDGRMMFVGYGMCNDRIADPEQRKESGKRAAMMQARYRLTEATTGSSFEIKGGKIVSSRVEGILSGDMLESYAEMRPDFYACVLWVYPDYVEFNNWGKTRRLKLEMRYPGDSASATADDYRRYILNVEAATLKLITDDAGERGYLKNNKLWLEHLYVLQYLHWDGRMVITVIYAEPE